MRDVRFRYHGYEIRTDAVPLGSPAHGLPTQARTPRETLCLRLKDAAYDFHATLFYRLTPEHDIIANAGSRSTTARTHPSKSKRPTSAC